MAGITETKSTRRERERDPPVADSTPLGSVCGHRFLLPLFPCFAGLHEPLANTKHLPRQVIHQHVRTLVRLGLKLLLAVVEVTTDRVIQTMENPRPWRNPGRQYKSRRPGIRSCDHG